MYRVKASFSEHPVVLPLMTPHSGERKGANVRACYTLQSLDSRWKIAVPRLGPAIIATRRHTPGPSAADVDVAFTTPSSPRPARRVPSSPTSCLFAPGSPLGDPQSTVHDLVIHPHPPSLHSSIRQPVIPLLPSFSPRRQIPRILPLSFALNSASGINPPGGSLRFSPRSNRAELSRAGSRRLKISRREIFATPSNPRSFSGAPVSPS